MRNSLKLFIAIVTISIFTYGCKKDDAKKSILKVGTTEYSISAGELINYGALFSPVPNLDLYLFSEGINSQTGTNGIVKPSGTGQLIYFELYTSLQTGLDSRVYNYDVNETEAEGTFDYAYYYTDYANAFNTSSVAGTRVYIESGTITVSKSGSDYVFEIDLVDENGKAITGYYKGSIPVYNNISKAASIDKVRK